MSEAGKAEAVGGADAAKPGSAGRRRIVRLTTPGLIVREDVAGRHPPVVVRGRPAYERIICQRRYGRVRIIRNGAADSPPPDRSSRRSRA